MAYGISLETKPFSVLSAPLGCDLAKLGRLKKKRNNYLRELVQIVLILVSVPP